MLKDKTIFAFLEVFHMPHRQSSLIEGRIFHYKVPLPLNFTSLKRILQKQSSGGILQKGALRNLAKFTGKHLCQRVLFNKVESLRLRPATLLKNSLAQVFSSEFGEISKNTFFHRTPPVAASDPRVG